ncbi:MAG: hypothetical protein AAGJ34_06950 [Pseudomonadota bacterium]
MFPNKAAIIFGTLLLGLMILDMILTRGATLVFLAREFVQMIEWLAFWR